MSQDGFVVVDKPAGWTSHDVVGKVRRLAKTRRVGHAGTLDPMATGVLVLGVHRATRLLGYAAGTTKAYAATIRLGQSTNTDDAMGEFAGGSSAEDLTEERIRAEVLPLTGDIEQVPSTVSAIKVDGKRAYKRAREGEAVELAARPIRVDAFEVLEVATPVDRAELGDRSLVDVRVTVECSSGTYIRALARDLGAALGVGGHLTALRRTRVGPWTLEAAHSLEALATDFTVVPIERVVQQTFPRVDVDADTARLVGFGQPLPTLPAPAEQARSAELVGIFDPDGRFLALYQADDADGPYRPVAVFTG